MGFRVRRVTTTRRGGVSRAPFDSFNLGDHVGDDPGAVAANRSRLAAALGVPDDHVIWMQQVHGDHVHLVEGPGTSTIPETDALVTTEPGIALAVLTADCVPVLFADAAAGVVAGAHAGRVGAKLGIVPRTIDAMVAAGAQAERISAFLGPAVSGRHYEVPADMAADVEQSLPGSRTTTSAGTPVWTCVPESPGSSPVWVCARSISTPGARSRTRICSVIVGSPARADWRR
ncbi:membrane protein YfiH [Mycobacteroides abscessus]|nr:membrane protein YfiH [Mycobacteroides abscessus]